MAEEVIGRADYVLGVDNAGVKKGVAEAEQAIRASGAKTEKEAESSAYRAGVAIGNGIKAGAKVVAAGASALFAYATKGMVELTNVQADYTAETGATADEAARAGKAINEMAGRNIQPLGEIGKTLAKVHTDLGLTGDEAEQTTGTFLRFARATKQEASASVLAFDDILDAWGLTAKDAQSIMDRLIVSHQKYGGSIAENQRALAQLAPALRGLNLTVDDGIALLNLFAANGLDAAAAQVALNSAITKLPKGESLQDFLVRLSKVEDSGARAQLAIDVFGQKAGPKLANAIRPGVDSLDDFKVGADEARGATEKAADALDDTFGAKAQLLMNKFASTLRSLGSDWGPLLTGGASALSLLTSIFGDDLIRRLGPGLVNAFRKLGAAGGDALADGVTAVWTGAGGTVVGNVIAERIENIVSSTKNSRLAEAIVSGAAKAGALWGVIFAGAQGLGSTLIGGLASAIAASPAAAPVRAAVLASAIQLGTLQGSALAGAVATAVTGAFTLAPLVIPAVLSFNFLKDHQPPGLPDFGKTFNEVVTEKAAAQAAERAAKAGAQAGDAYGDEMIARARRSMSEELGPAVATGLAQGTAAVNVDDSFATPILSAIAGAFRKGTPTAAKIGRAIAAATAQGTVDEIHQQRDTVDTAWEALVDGLTHQLSPTKERARLLGRLASTKLIEGLHSKDPEVRAQAEVTKDAILTRLDELRTSSKNIGEKGMDALKRAMHSKDPDIRTAARAIYNAAKHGKDGLGLEDLGALGRTSGNALGAGLVAAMKAYYFQVGQAAAGLASAIADYIETHSPARRGPLSRSGGPEGMGRLIGAGLTKGLGAEIGSLHGLLGRSLSGFNAPLLNQVAAGGDLARVNSTSVRHGDVTIGAVHLHGIGSDVSPAAAKRFGQSVLDAVADGLERENARFSGVRIGSRP